VSKRISILAVLIGMLVLVGTAGAQTTSNLLGNPGFEAPLGGTQTSGTAGSSFGNWTAYSFRPAIPLPAEVSAPNPVHGGNMSGEVTDPPGIGSAFFYQDLSSFDPNSTYTISAWVYPVTGSQSLQFVFGWDRGAQGYVAGSSEFGITPTEVNFGAWGQTGNPAPSVTYNTWHHVQLVVDDSTLTSRLYIDGSCQGTSPTGQAVPSGSASTMFMGYGSVPPTENHFYWDDMELTPGIQVTGSCPAGGNGLTTAVSPTVNTLAAQNVGETFATLTGTLNTHGHAAYYRFELDFGLAGAGATYYGFATPTQQALAVDGNQPVYAPIGGLIPGASYNFALVVSYDGAFSSPTLGNILAFQTTAPPMTKKDKGFIGTLIGAGATAVGGVFCGGALLATPVTLGASDVAGCAVAGLGIASFGVSLVEPPDSKYGVIFRPVPYTIRLKLPTICTQVHIQRGSACASLQRAARRYWTADGRVVSLAEALAVTVDRFGGAEKAASTSGEALQRSGMLMYLTRLKAATAALHAAGRRFASQLGRDHYDPLFSARQIARGRHDLSDLKGMPSSIIRRLIKDGIIGSRTDLKRLIVEGLSRAGTPHRVDLRYLLTH
jgi:Concanavalin A-like lectin/glucanases superfamily